MSQRGAFLTALVTKSVGDGLYELVLPLKYLTGSRYSTYVSVPKGFKTDYASIPPILQWIWPRKGKYDAPAVVHDYLCQNTAFPKHVADYIFWDAMGVVRCYPLTRWLFYLAVRTYHIFSHSR